MSGQTQYDQAEFGPNSGKVLDEEGEVNYIIDAETGAIRTTEQDSDNPIKVLYMSLVEGETTLTANASVGDTTITVANAAGIIIVDYLYIGIFNETDNTYHDAHVLSKNGNELTLDTPLGFPMYTGDKVAYGTSNLNVDGSTTPKTFTTRGGDPGIQLEFDAERIIFSCICSDTVSLELFANLAKLVKGIVLRVKRINGTYNNIHTIKSNKDFGGLAYDWTPYAASRPNEGVDGFLCRFTFSKLGNPIRVRPGEDIEIFIPEDLTNITVLQARLGGHVVID